MCSYIYLSFSKIDTTEKGIDRQTSAPTGYVSTTSPIVIKKVQIKKETVENVPVKVKEVATATATIQIHPPPATKPARIKINVIKPTTTENKENMNKNDGDIKVNLAHGDKSSKIPTESKITLTLPIST